MASTWREPRIVRVEESEVHGEEQRGVELRLAGHLARADLIVPASRLEELARALLDRACAGGELKNLRVADLGRAPAPAQCMRTEKVWRRLPAELPETRVGLVEPRVHLVDEALDHLHGRTLRHAAGEARVEERRLTASTTRRRRRSGRARRPDFRCATGRRR